jgi:uncharacterized protein YndB with AHSA1/START domain
MTVIEERIDIRAPIGVVFAALTDPRRAPEWNPNIIEVKLLSGLPIGEGTRWRQVTVVLGKHTNLVCRIVRFRPPYEGTLEISGEFRSTIQTICREVDGATQVTQRMEFTVPGGMFGRMAANVARMALRREVVHGMERQRAALEREAGGSDGPGTA